MIRELGVYKNMFDNMFDIVLIVSSEGKILYGNKSAQQFYGYTEGELIQKGIFDIRTEDKRELIQGQLCQAGMHGIEFETLHRKKDGSLIPVKVRSVSPDMWKNGQVVSFIYDMTLFHEMQDKANIMETSLNLTSEAVIVLDLDFKVKNCNQMAEIYFGYLKEELIGKPVMIIIPEERWTETSNIKQILQSGKQILLMKTERRHRDGHILNVTISVSPLFDEHGKIVSYLGLYNDITELTQKEQELHELQKRAVFALEGGNFGVWELDLSLSDYIRYNNLEDMLGYGDGELGNSFNEFRKQLSPGDLQHILQEFERKKRGIEPFQFEFRIFSKRKNEYVWIRMKGKAFQFFDDGSPKKLIGTFEDITDKKQFEADLILRKSAWQDMAKKAETENAAKKMFLANMSHEIKNPLNGISTALQILLKEEMSPEQKEMLSIISSSNETLNGIVTEILDYSKTEKEGVHLNKEIFQLEECMLVLFRELQIAANQKGIAASYFIDPAIQGNYAGDIQKIKQVLHNLMANSLKFTEDGFVGIQVRQLETAENGCLMEFIVKDTGIGIKDIDKDKVFEPFVQAGNGSSKNHGGAGLGLAIAKKMATTMGGTLEFDSQEGNGTTFCFRCPLDKVNAVNSKEAKRFLSVPESLNDNKGKVILSIDDSLTNQELIGYFLAQNGYKCLCAFSSEEALQMLQEQQADLILMDIQLPKTNGYQLAAQIRGTDGYGHLPIIAMTAYAQSENREKCIQSGMDGYISKPLDLDDLLQLIQNI